MDILRGGWAPGLLGNGAGLRADSPSTGGYSTEAEAIFAAFTTPPTTGRKDLIDAAVVALKAAGVWTKLDALYAFAAADSQAALINWKQPGTYNGTAVNSPTFTADRGYTGGGASYIDMNFNPTTATTPNYVQDSASIFAWAVNNVNPAAGMAGTATNIVLAPRWSDNNAYARINNTPTNVSVASTDSTGFWSVCRTTSTLTTLYKNGASVTTGAAASSAVVNAGTAVLTGQSAFWTGQCAGAGIGSGLTGADNTALYNALRTYLTGVGVP